MGGDCYSCFKNLKHFVVHENMNDAYKNMNDAWTSYPSPDIFLVFKDHFYISDIF